MECALSVHGACTERAWTVHGVCTDHAQTVHGACIQHIQIRKWTNPNIKDKQIWLWDEVKMWRSSSSRSISTLNILCTDWCLLAMDLCHNSPAKEWRHIVNVDQNTGQTTLGHHGNVIVLLLGHRYWTHDLYMTHLHRQSPLDQSVTPLSLCTRPRCTEVCTEW